MIIATNTPKKIITITEKQKEILISESIEDEGFNIDNGTISYDRNSFKLADTSIYSKSAYTPKGKLKKTLSPKDFMANGKGRKMFLPNTKVVCYNLYQLFDTGMEVNKALKHGSYRLPVVNGKQTYRTVKGVDGAKDTETPFSEKNTIVNDKSMNDFWDDTYEYIKKFLTSLAFIPKTICYPKSSSGLNKTVCEKMGEIFGNNNPIVINGDGSLIKNIKNAELDVKKAKKSIIKILDEWGTTDESAKLSLEQNNTYSVCDSLVDDWANKFQRWKETAEAISLLDEFNNSVNEIVSAIQGNNNVDSDIKQLNQQNNTINKKRKTDFSHLSDSFFKTEKIEESKGDQLTKNNLFRYSLPKQTKQSNQIKSLPEAVRVALTKYYKCTGELEEILKRGDSALPMVIFDDNVSSGATLDNCCEAILQIIGQNRKKELIALSLGRMPSKGFDMQAFDYQRALNKSYKDLRSYDNEIRYLGSPEQIINDNRDMFTKLMSKGYTKLPSQIVNVINFPNKFSQSFRNDSSLKNDYVQQVYDLFREQNPSLFVPKKPKVKQVNNRQRGSVPTLPLDKEKLIKYGVKYQTARLRALKAIERGYQPNTPEFEKMVYGINEGFIRKIIKNVISEMKAQHISPYDFDEFKLDASTWASGEKSAISHGFGIYVAIDPYSGGRYVKSALKNDKENPQAIFYDVDIPDFKGNNYILMHGTMDESEFSRINNIFKETFGCDIDLNVAAQKNAKKSAKKLAKGGVLNGFYVMDCIEGTIEQSKAYSKDIHHGFAANRLPTNYHASKFLNQKCGYVGGLYMGRNDRMCAFIFNPSDIKINKKINVKDIINISPLKYDFNNKEEKEQSGKERDKYKDDFNNSKFYQDRLNDYYTQFPNENPQNADYKPDYMKHKVNECIKKIIRTL